MLRATTLVHKGAMEIGVHAIRTFAYHFGETHSLNIHTDPSIDEQDRQLLLEAAKGIQVQIISAKERGDKATEMLAGYPRTREFLNRASYFAKLEIPMFEEEPYFFFDSDIVFLRHVTNLKPTNSLNAFSTETWSWYTGITNEKLWIKAKTPRRVNSGFHFIGQQFPYEKMEDMLMNDMFDNTILYAGDQEIFAYLFNAMEYYHPQDLKRSRVGGLYQLNNEKCAALHFPGKMWIAHLDQIKALPGPVDKPAMQVRYQPAVPLTAAELLRMRIQVRLGRSTLLAKPLNVFRKWRRAYR